MGDPKRHMPHGEDIVCSLQKCKDVFITLDRNSDPGIMQTKLFIGGGSLTKSWTVYVHINKFNGKRYVGITSKKKPEHRWESGGGYVGNPHFYSAIQKYGWDGFNHEIVADGLDFDSAKQMECDLIKECNTQDNAFGYNMTSGGEGTPGYHPSPETRAKLSIARRKENLSEETLKRRSDGLRGRKFSEEHKRKIGDGNSKSILMYEKDGTFVKQFRAARDAELEFGISHSHISQCCHGQRHSAGGYIWQFA